MDIRDARYHYLKNLTSVGLLLGECDGEVVFNVSLVGLDVGSYDCISTEV